MEERSNGSRSTTSKKKRAAQSRKRGRGTGGILAIRDGVWRIDIEVKRDPITGQRRRVSRTVYGTRDEAEVTLARLRVAGHENRLAIGGTKPGRSTPCSRSTSRPSRPEPSSWPRARP